MTSQKIRIINGRILADGVVLSGYEIWVEGEKIAAVQPRRTASSDPEAVAVDAQGLYVAPGFIDTHIHGGWGVDFTASSAEEIESVARKLLSVGVTSFCPTLAGFDTSSIGSLAEKFRPLINNPISGARILGIHWEGPYLNPLRHGALPSRHFEPQVTSVPPELLDASLTRIVTLAPELPGALSLIEKLSERHIIAAAGHSAATLSCVEEASEHGLRHVTHLFNAMEPFHHRQPGLPGAALLCDELTASIIADGVHLDRGTIRLIARVKGIGGLILISDSTAAMGKEDGRYSLGHEEVIIKDGVAKTAEGNLAGSVTPLNVALRHFIEATGEPLESAIKTLTEQPALLVGVGDKLGKIRAGYLADLVCFDDEMTVHWTMVNGRVISTI